MVTNLDRLTRRVTIARDSHFIVPDACVQSRIEHQFSQVSVAHIFAEELCETRSGMFEASSYGPSRVVNIHAAFRSPCILMKGNDLRMFVQVYLIKAAFMRHSLNYFKLTIASTTS